MAINPPVLRHREWRFLLRDFIGAHPDMAVVPNNVLKFGLAPAANVARWLCMELPGVLEKDSLTLVIPGASFFECADDGRWFAFLPWMLGRPGLQIEVHLIGDELNPLMEVPGSSLKVPHNNVTAAARTLQRFPAAKLFDGTLGTWRASSSAVPVDACILFSPGFTKHYESWFAPGELGEYMSTVPMGVFSYSSLDFLEDKAVLRMLGFAFDAHEMGPSPWVLGDEDQLEAIGGFGGYAWTLENVVCPEKIDLDNDELVEFIELEQFLLEDSGRWGPDAAIRRLITPVEVGNDSVLDEIYRMPGDYAVLKSSGLVGYTDDVGFMPLTPPRSLPPEVLASRPQGNELEQVMWALRVFRDQVQPLLDDEDSPDLESLMGGLDDASMEDMISEFAKLVTGEDVDGQDLLSQIRVSGGMHGPTHPHWFDLLASLGWNPTDYVDDPERLNPAFFVSGARYAKAGLPVVCESYAFTPDDAEDDLAITAMVKLETLYPEGVLLGFKSIPFKEIEGHKYSFGGLLYWKGAWHQFAMTTEMTSIDEVIEQVQSGFSFQHVIPKYADDNTMLAVPFNRMCFGHDPNEPGPMMALQQASGWVTLMPA